MNIFYLDQDASVSAKAMTNKHIIKMILESAQLMSTAHRVLDGEKAINKDLLYKATHINHPSAKWVRESKSHYEWLFEHFLELVAEYFKRYGRKHLTYTKLASTLINVPKNIPDRQFVEPPCAMPDQYRIPNNSVASYRNYYVAEKLKIIDDIARFKTTLGV